MNTSILSNTHKKIDYQQTHKSTLQYSQISYKKKYIGDPHVILLLPFISKIKTKTKQILNSVMRDA